MQLNKNQYVVFSNGEKHGYMEARWSERAQAFYTFVEDEEGSRTKIYSMDIREKAPRAKKAFTPSAAACTVRINPHAETEKAYVLEDGSNGKITRGNMKVYYKYIAKSVCFVADNGEIFAPSWAVK